MKQNEIIYNKLQNIKHNIFEEDRKIVAERTNISLPTISNYLNDVNKVLNANTGLRLYKEFVRIIKKRERELEKI